MSRITSPVSPAVAEPSLSHPRRPLKRLIVTPRPAEGANHHFVRLELEPEPEPTAPAFTVRQALAESARRNIREVA